jgi:hypothetical protein
MRIALVGQGEAGKYADEGRLAGAVRTQQGEELATLDAQVDLVEGLKLAVPLAQTS